MPGGGIMGPAPAPGSPTNITATADFSQLTGGNGAQMLSNGGFNNVTFKYDSTTADGLFNEASGDTINGGFFRGMSDFQTGNDKGLGTSDMLKLDINLPMFLYFQEWYKYYSDWLDLLKNHIENM